MSEQPTLTKADLELLQELGLKGCQTYQACEIVIDTLRMRQLDKLKMILARVAGEGYFSLEIREGIRKNDLRIFASAVLELNKKSLEKG